jgi:hypothetical protein
MSWVRLWSDMPTDPKWRVIAKRANRPLAEVMSVFVLMMTNAGANATERGELCNWSDEDAAAALDIEPSAVTAIREAMQGKTLEGEKLTGWEKRQPKREDGSAERAKAWRERNRTQPNAPKRPDSDSDTDSEAEKNTTVQSEQVAAREDGRTPVVDELKLKFNGSTDAMLAFVETAMGPGSRTNAAQWLASTTSAHGSAAVAQAFAAITEKQAAGEIISRPLPLWSSIAGGMKAGSNRRAPAEKPRKRGVMDVLRENPMPETVQ